MCLPALNAGQLRREISARNLVRGENFENEVSWSSIPSVVYREFEGRHGNFLEPSWARITANPLWKKRLGKSYTGSRSIPRAGDRQRFELECASSSDALLMNVFCYPRVLHRPALCGLLGIEPGLTPEFGFCPSLPRLNGHADRTEIDMRVGELLVEAKLTEGDFRQASLKMLSSYRDVDQVFDIGLLPVRRGAVDSWQLVRGVVAAHRCAASFLVLCDGRRADLMERWFAVMRAVADSSLRTRLRLTTWQEVCATLPRPLQKFVGEKYGIAGVVDRFTPPV